jgi:hypothetical protein
LQADRTRQSADHLILNLEHSRAGRVESVTPDLVAQLRVYQARIDADLVAVQ